MNSFPPIPEYEIHEILGAGGMGAVYLATRAGHEKKCAIKMMLGGRDATLSEIIRFRVEAEAYSRCFHRNIVRVYDVGAVGGCPYIVMEYAENGALDKYLAQQSKLDLNWLVHAMQSVADALSYAHERGMLHRDLKPSNLLVAADRSVRVADFGLVKFQVSLKTQPNVFSTILLDPLDSAVRSAAGKYGNLGLTDADFETVVRVAIDECSSKYGLTTESFDVRELTGFAKSALPTSSSSNLELDGYLAQLTQQGTVMGSPQFMSPEQALGQTLAIGPQTDVYGLGATFYSLLTGQPPFAASTTRDLFNCIANEQPAWPSDLNSEISEDLNLVIMKAMAKKVDERYSSMRELSQDLARVLEGKRPQATMPRSLLAVRRRNSLKKLADSFSTVIKYFGTKK